MSDSDDQLPYAAPGGENEDDALHALQCLFCPQTSADRDRNVSHVRVAHSFVVPPTDELTTDLDTFLSYLALVVDTAHTCLWCGSEKRSSEAVRAHMLFYVYAGDGSRSAGCVGDVGIPRLLGVPDRR